MPVCKEHSREPCLDSFSMSQARGIAEATSFVGARMKSVGELLLFSLSLSAEVGCTGS